MDGWVKHFYLYDNTWLDVYVNLFYTDSVSKLNSMYKSTLLVYKLFSHVRIILTFYETNL